MSREARRRLVTFVADRVLITADMDEDEVNVAVRTIQGEFKALAAPDPDLYHETCQAALRSVIRHLRSNTQPRDDDGEPDYLRFRREQGFHHYESH